MDFTAILVSFGAILSIVALVGTGLNYAFNRGQQGRGRRLTQRIVVTLSLLLLVGALVLQYLVDYPNAALGLLLTPADSPLNACHVTAQDLPQLSDTTTASVSPTPSPRFAGQSLTINGSSVLSLFFKKAVAIPFNTVNKTNILVNVENSTAGLTDVNDGTADIGLSDIFKEDAPAPYYAVHKYDLLDYQVAAIAFTVLVSADLKDSIHNLTTDQIISIYSGKITNWHQIGGPLQPIKLATRDIGSGTRTTFENYVLRGAQANGDQKVSSLNLLDYLAHTRGAIGFASTTSLTPLYQKSVFPVCIDGHGATVPAINVGNYTFWSVEHAYLKQQPANDSLTAAVLAYICRADFQTNTLANAGFLPLGKIQPATIDARTQGKAMPQPCLVA